jgi:hypothetical protein
MTQAPKNIGATTAIAGLLSGLLALVPEAKKGIAQGLILEVQQVYRKDTKASRTTNQPQAPGLDLTNLRKVVAEEVRAAIRETPPKPIAKPTTRTWADIARGPTPGLTGPLAKVIPAQQDREVLVKGGSLQADLAKRTPLEIT